MYTHTNILLVHVCGVCVCTLHSGLCCWLLGNRQQIFKVIIVTMEIDVYYGQLCIVVRM